MYEKAGSVVLVLVISGIDLRSSVQVMCVLSCVPSGDHKCGTNSNLLEVLEELCENLLWWLILG